MKSFTDLEQSKELAQILSHESADVWYLPIKRDEKIYYDLTIHHSLTRGIIPAWSLSALLNVLPYPQLSKDKLGSGKEGWMVSVYPDCCRFDSSWYDNPIDACYEMIAWLEKQGKKGDREMKTCENCQLFRQLRYKGGETWYNYCYRDGYLNPCSGNHCDFPKYFKPIKEDKK